MRTYDNVIFSDTYYRNGGSDIIDPHGQKVDGSHNLDLNNSVQKTHELSAHMSVTAYYHGTIDFNAIENNDALVHGSWYDHSTDKPPRDRTGFHYSAIVAGKRPGDGIGTNFGGAGVRSSVKLKGTQWPNIVNAKVKGTNTVDVNQPITLVASYNDSDSSAKVTFFFDKDHNPYNGNTALSLGAESVASTSGSKSVGVDATLSKLNTGSYFLGAKITDPDGHTRYTYAVHAINVVHADFASFKDGVVSVSGTSGSDTIEISRIGKGTQSVMHIMRNGVLQTLYAPDVGKVSVDAGSGDDTVIAGAGAPRMYVYGNKGNDVIKGGIGDDTLVGGTGTNHIEGRDGNDSIVGSNGPDALLGGRGNDTLLGGPGNDTLDGGSGIDVLNGGDGTNVLSNA
jgi:Ca2+-binding RTX toxin-like protein